MTTKTIASLALVAGLALASTLHAQAPVEKPAAPPAAAPEAPKKAEVLSDAEKAAIDLVSVMAQRDQAIKERDGCMASLTPLQAQQRDAQIRARVDTLRQVIERSHPGHKWDIEKGTLVPDPAKVAKAEPKAAPPAAPKKD